jgi:hypothetical protein
MASLTSVMRESYVERMFAAYFARKFYIEHRAEAESTSPYAVTDKIPTMRIVDNPITKGQGHISSVHSSVTRGFFGGIKGFSASGGGGSWELDTKVQFDHISMCPVTGREFTDAELKKHHDDWDYRIESHGRTEAKQLTHYEDPGTGTITFRYYQIGFRFNREDLEDLQMVNRSGDDLITYMEDHIVESLEETT